MKRRQFSLATLVFWTILAALGFALNHVSAVNQRWELILDAWIMLAMAFLFAVDLFRAGCKKSNETTSTSNT
jgi:hypothetical protein